MRMRVCMCVDEGVHVCEDEGVDAAGIPDRDGDG